MARILLKEIGKCDLSHELFVVGLSSNENMLEYLNQSPFSHLLDKIKNLIDIKNNSISQFGKSLFLILSINEKIFKVLLIGIGNEEHLSTDKIRQLGGIISLKARELNFSNVVISNFFQNDDRSIPLSEGLLLSLYSFQTYKTENDLIKQTKSYADFFDRFEVNILCSIFSEDIQKSIDQTLKITDAIFYTRNLANSPPNVINPQELANHSINLGKSGKIHVKVFDKKQIEEMKLNGILSVGKGSINEPRLIIMEYSKGKPSDPPILLVGKGVTFDTGGISIKPSDKMDEMKYDKNGGCTVIGIMKAVSDLNIPVNVIGVVPTVENMPSGSSYRPGDIITMYNGKTVEVLNTDAEGRLILADALAYGVSEYKPKCIIDFATLTGACIIALGSNIAGIMGNNQNLISKLIEISHTTDEKIWELPLHEEFFELIKSNVANIKNIGGRTGGTITAAAFLANFVTNTPWAHIDIAGTAWTQDGTMEKSYNPKGATGFGIRTIIKFLEQNMDNGYN